MGIFKDLKSSMVGKEAAKAREDGRLTFAALLNTPASHTGVSGVIDDWGVMVDAIEAEGWSLSMWAAAVDAKGKPQAYPLFRRTQA